MHPLSRLGVPIVALVVLCTWVTTARADPFDADTSVAGLFNLDVMLRASLHDTADDEWAELVLPELGFSLSAFDRHERSTARVGVGYGAAWGLFLVGVVPSLVIGAEHRQAGAGFGFRVSGIAELIWIGGLSVSYQMMAIGGRVAHELQVGASINLLPVLLLAD